MRPSTTQQGSRLPSLLLASAGIAFAALLVRDALDPRIFTAESLFDSRATALLAALGAGMAGVLLWDFFTSRR
jgi:hypothetical protein